MSSLHGTGNRLLLVEEEIEMSNDIRAASRLSSSNNAQSRPQEEYEMGTTILFCLKRISQLL
jgi:hypothetical protein